MKQSIIKTVSFFMFIPFFAVAMVVYGAIVSGAIGQAIVFGAGGWSICCLLTGFWFCLSGLYDESVKQTKILKAMLDNK